MVHASSYRYHVRCDDRKTCGGRYIIILNAAYFCVRKRRLQDGLEVIIAAEIQARMTPNKASRSSNKFAEMQRTQSPTLGLVALFEPLEVPVLFGDVAIALVHL